MTKKGRESELAIFRSGKRIHQVRQEDGLGPDPIYISLL